MAEQLSLKNMMKGNVLILTLSRVLWSMSDSIVLPYLSLFILSLGGTKNTIGDVYFIGSVAACLLYPIGGYIADKSGRSRLVGIATLLYSSSFIIFALAPNWLYIALAYAYQQTVLFYMPALNAIMADSIPVGGRGRIYALTIAIPEAVRIITPYIGGALIAAYTLQPAMRLGYVFSTIIGLFVAFLRIKYLKDTIKGQPIGRNIIKIFYEAYKAVYHSVNWIWINIRGYTLVALILTLAGSTILPFWIVYATEVIKLSAYDWGLIMLIGGITKTIMSLIVGNIVDHIGSRKCMLASFILAIPSMFIFTLINGFYAVIPLYIILVISSTLMWISSSVFLANSIPRENRGRIMSALGSGMSIGITGGGYSSGFLIFIPMALGSKLGGIIYTINPVFPWYLQSVSLLIAMILTFFYIKDKANKEQ
ncbi:MFS transporter [Candidatus Bathyarchaeota archaeon]|nr:MFS transporter [Candidatus Bathyarchaeota archaeon]